MKTIDPYPKQKAIFFLIGLVGLIGTLFLILNLIFKWDLNNFSFGIYPIFLVQAYQYWELKKNTIAFSKEQISWKLAYMEDRKSIELNGEKVQVSSDWKGISLRKGQDLIEISLDTVWEGDRKRVFEELTTYYS